LRPKEIQTRFLYPFFFVRDSAGAAAKLLSEATLSARDGQPIKIWDRGEPPALYREELLDHVDRFLFQDASRGCKYLRVSSTASSKWFNKVQVVLRESPHTNEPESSKESSNSNPIIWPVKLVPLASIEIFLTNYGVGVLSVSLRPDVDELDFENTTLFNYKLSQLRPQVSARLRIPHPSENKPAWEHMSVEQKERIGPEPAGDASAADRIGRPGGGFLLGEFVSEVLLKPLTSLDLEDVQKQFSVYTVVRFGNEVDFDQSEISKSLAAFLSGISQVEEPGHAGSPIGVVGVTNAILNRRHSAAVGLLGMAHIVADQSVRDLSFNNQRVPRVMVKYFVPYLLAMLQRGCLHRAIREASDLVLDCHRDTAAGLSTLRRHILEFALEGYFPEISHREVLDRYYRMVQEGLGVRRAYKDVSRAIADIDSQFAADHQAKLAETMAENVAATRSLQGKMTQHLQVVANVQTMVGWIEVFFVSVYLAELWHLFALHVDRLQHWIPHGVIAGAVLGALGASAVLRPWKHGASEPSQ
jgi:hypothetical protein